MKPKRWYEFGALLPFIGFHRFPVDDFLRMDMGLDETVKEVEAFSIEWLWCGITFCGKPVESSNDNAS